MRRSQAYIGTVRMLGVLALAASLAVPDIRNPKLFAAYLCVAVLLSFLKLKLPGLTSSISLNTIPLLVAIAELSASEAALIGCAGILVQSFWRAKKRPDWERLSFNLAVIVIAVNASGMAFRGMQTVHAVGPVVAFATLALTFYVVNTLPICNAIALTERKRLSEIWRAAYSSSFHLLMAAAAAAGIFTLTGESRWLVSAALLPIFCLVYRAYWMLLARMQEEKNHVAEAASLNLRTIEALVGVIQARAGAIAGDSLVPKYALDLAKQFHLPEPELKALAAAALLRDIGNVAIPDHLLARPGQLTSAETERVKRHVVIGADILARVNFPYPVVPIVRAHHEKWDGTGYPDGLKGDEIPLGGRILAAVDALIAMTSERPHRAGIPVHEAMRIMLAEAGRSFDPRVVDALESRMADLRLHLQRIKEEPHAYIPDSGNLLDTSEDTNGVLEDALESIRLARREEEVLARTGGFLSLEESLSVFAVRLSRVVQYDAIAIYSLVGDRLVPRYVGGAESKPFESQEIPVGTGISGIVAEKGKALICRNNTGAIPLWHHPIKAHIRSAIAVPTESSTGRRGVLLCTAPKKM